MSEERGTYYASLHSGGEPTLENEIEGGDNGYERVILEGWTDAMLAHLVASDRGYVLRLDRLSKKPGRVVFPDATKPYYVEYVAIWHVPEGKQPQLCWFGLLNGQLERRDRVVLTP